MIGKPGLVEQLIIYVSDVYGTLNNYPKSVNQLIYWDRRQYYRNREKLREEERRERARIKQALWRLEKASYITFDRKKSRYTLTPSGWLKFLGYYSRKQNKTKSKHKRTEKYIIIFDIPEEHRRFRDLFRLCLKNTGCTFIQHSVYQTADMRVFKLMQKIVSNCQLYDHVKFIEVKTMY